MRPVVGLRYGTAVKFLSSAIILFAIIMYAVSYWTIIDIFWKDFFKTIAEALVGAGIVSFVFGWLNQRDLVERIDEIFIENVSNLFHPIEKIITHGAWDDYRWDCMLESVNDKNDPNQDWCVQNLCISHTTIINSPNIYLIGAVSEVPGALDEYTKNKEFIFRWRMTGDPSKINIESENNYKVEVVLLDGVPLKIEKANLIDVAGGRAVITKCTVPQARRGRQTYLTFYVKVRKYFPDHGAVDVISEIRNIARNVEFRLIIDGSLKARQLHCEGSGIRPLNPADVNPLMTQVPRGVNGSMSAKIVARYPVQAGSKLHFTVSI